MCIQPSTLGLGKTVTALSLVMRTRGVRPKEPHASVSPPDRESSARGISDDVEGTEQMGRMSSSGGSGRKRRSARLASKPDCLVSQVGASSTPSDKEMSTPVPLLSPATIILVPTTELLYHWEAQINKHVQREWVRVGVLDEMDFSISKELTATQIAHDYDIVLVTMARVLHDQERAILEEPPLAQIRFLRAIIDDGYDLMNSFGVAKFNSVCQSITAERKWVITGAPTPNTLDNDLKGLRHFLRWLDSDGFDKRRWVKGVERPFETFKPWILPQIQELLGRIMVRSSKKMISSIPKCEFSITFITFTKENAKNYNELVSVAIRNMMLADWYSEDHEASILHPKNTEACRELLSNIRLACCFTG